MDATFVGLMGMALLVCSFFPNAPDKFWIVGMILTMMFILKD